MHSGLLLALVMAGSVLASPTHVSLPQLNLIPLKNLLPNICRQTRLDADIGNELSHGKRKSSRRKLIMKLPLIDKLPNTEKTMSCKSDATDEEVTSSAPMSCSKFAAFIHQHIDLLTQDALSIKQAVCRDNICNSRYTRALVDQVDAAKFRWSFLFRLYATRSIHWKRARMADLVNLFVKAETKLMAIVWEVVEILSGEICMQVSDWDAFKVKIQEASAKWDKIKFQ